MKHLFTGILIGFITTYALAIYIQLESSEPMGRDMPEFEFVEPVAEPAGDYTPPRRFSEKEAHCLQQNIFFEARNQSHTARIAVAWVALNRVKSPKYRNSICGVIYRGKHVNGIPVKKRCAFSWYCDQKPDRPANNKIELAAWDDAGAIALHMLKHCYTEVDSQCPVDPTNGALFYFNPRLADPVWKITKVKTASIGDHDFYAYAD